MKKNKDIFVETLHYLQNLQYMSADYVFFFFLLGISASVKEK